MLKHKYIVIEGNIGAGKTSLAKMIAAEYKGKLILEEFAENTFLREFYKDPDRFAFPLEMSFMAERYQQMKNIFDEHGNDGQLIVSDYFFDKSLLFAKVNLKKEEFRLFESFFQMAKKNLPEPGLLIYLKKDVPLLQKNIQKRGRDFEKQIAGSYLSAVNDSYDNYLDEKKNLKKLTINSNELDFISHPPHFKSILEMIKLC